MKYSPLQAPAAPSCAESVPSLQAGVKVALLFPPSAAPRRPVIFPRSGQQHPAKPPWELLQTAWCYIEDRCNMSSFPPVWQKCCELVGQSKLDR